MSPSPRELALGGTQDHIRRLVVSSPLTHRNSKRHCLLRATFGFTKFRADGAILVRRQVLDRSLGTLHVEWVHRNMQLDEVVIGVVAILQECQILGKVTPLIITPPNHGESVPLLGGESLTPERTHVVQGRNVLLKARTHVEYVTRSERSRCGVSLGENDSIEGSVDALIPGKSAVYIPDLFRSQIRLVWFQVWRCATLDVLVCTPRHAIEIGWVFQDAIEGIAVRDEILRHRLTHDIRHKLL